MSAVRNTFPTADIIILNKQILNNMKKIIITDAWITKAAVWKNGVVQHLSEGREGSDYARSVFVVE